MRRPRRHDQRTIPTGTVCPSCTRGDCTDCVDLVRIMAGLADKHGMLCQCRKRSHSTEPATRQISDPETNDVYAPGLIVSEDGTITRNE